MTDNYHTDQETHDEENAHDVVSAHEAEHYGDTQPPVDDFSDESHEAQGTEDQMQDTAIVEEGDEPEAFDDGVPLEAKKSSKLFMAAVTVGVILLAGTLMYFQFFSGDEAPAHPIQVASTQPPTPKMAPPTSNASPAVPGVEHMSDTSAKIDDISNLKQIVAQQETAKLEGTAPKLASGDKGYVPEPTPSQPISSTMVGEQPMTGTASIPGSLGPTASAPAIPGVAPASPEAPHATDAGNSHPQTAASPLVPSLPTIPPGAQQATTSSSVPGATVPEPVPTTAVVSKTAPSVPQITQQATSHMPPSPLSVTAPTAQDTAAQARIAALTAQVASLQKSLDQAMDKLNRVETVATSNTSQPTLESEPMVHTTKHAVRAKPKHTKLAHSTSHHVVKSASMKQGWILRAAVPGEAWVAKSSATSDLRHVKIGDSLPGIGRVVDIVANGDSWVIRGTQGSVQ